LGLGERKGEGGSETRCFSQRRGQPCSGRETHTHTQSLWYKTDLVRRTLRSLCFSLPLLIFLLAAAEVAAVTLNPGDILIADQGAFGGGGGVIRVDPTTGIQTTVSSGGSFVNPFGIAIAPAQASFPEPATLLLLGAGLAGLALRRRLS
jgi:hypothetical protein